MNIIETDYAWAAGLFDGEGCISIGYVKPSARNGLVNPSYRLTIKVTMGHEPTVSRIQKIMQTGTVQKHVAKTDRVNASYSWVAQSRMAGIALSAMRPYFLTKAEEADIALEFCALPDVERGGKRGSPPISIELLLEKHRLYKACALVKSRYRFRSQEISDTPEWKEGKVQSEEVF